MRRRACSAPAHGSRRRSRVRVVASIAPPELRAQQDVERLRRGHDDVRRPPARPVALGRGRVAGAHPGADLDIRQSPCAQRLRGCRPAAPPGCAGCRWRAPSAARHRRPGSRPAARPPAPAARARRSRRGRRPASCPSRSGRRSAHAGPAWIAGQPPPAPPSARRSCGQTSRRPPDGTARSWSRDRSNVANGRTIDSAADDGGPHSLCRHDGYRHGPVQSSTSLPENVPYTKSPSKREPPKHVSTPCP